MKPAAFDYVRPASVDQALDLLAEHGDDATLLAGGQSLLPMMNLRLAQPALVVDLNELAELAFVELRAGMVAIGALARQRDVERSPECRERCPVIVEALRFVGTPQTRNRGTVGGNLAHADPTSELPAVVTACRAAVVLASRRGTRELPATEFFLGPHVTAREPDELLVEVRVPAFARSTGWAFEELAWSFTAHPIVAVAAVADSAGVRVAVSGVSGTPRLIATAADLADVADGFRRSAAADLVRRTREQAVARAA
ncbi:MAG TPA: FAD binding domain-containing protein [Gaiellales bacterium]|nr:FAD binding domain-containing protein [Gaiellales bacterium]